MSGVDRCVALVILEGFLVLCCREFIKGNPNYSSIVEAKGQVDDNNQEDGSNPLPNRKESAILDSDTSTPRGKLANVGEGSGNSHSSKRRKNSSSKVAESIRSLSRRRWSRAIFKGISYLKNTQLQSFVGF